MKITRRRPKTTKIRADSLGEGDAFVADETVFVVISSNPDHLIVLTRKNNFLPKVLVANLSSGYLGWVKRDKKVLPVNLELNVTLKG